MPERCNPSSGAPLPFASHLARPAVQVTDLALGPQGAGWVFEAKNSIEVAVVKPADLESLAHEWHQLWRCCPQATPFLSPAWVLPWARHYAPQRCGAAVMRASGRLVAIIPIFCWEGAILLAGTGPSDRGDILIHPGFESDAHRLVAALPLAAPEPFDRIDLQQLDGESPLLAAAVPKEWRTETMEGDACLMAPLHGERGLGAASGRQRSHWRHALRQLERLGGSAGLVASDEVRPAVEDLFRLNDLRWGDTGVLRDTLIRAFLLDAGPELDRAGLLRLWEVQLEQRRIAVLLALAGPWAHHGYNGGFDPSYSRLSPSAVLVGLAMEQAAHEGRAKFDFLRGHESYKTVWGAASYPMHRRIMRPDVAP